MNISVDMNNARKLATDLQVPFNKEEAFRPDSRDLSLSRQVTIFRY
jgi:hypothetical protein